MTKSKKIFKLIIILIGVLYATVTFATQQKTLNQYSKNCEELSEQIQEQEEYKQELSKKKDDKIKTKKIIKLPIFNPSI